MEAHEPLSMAVITASSPEYSIAFVACPDASSPHRGLVTGVHPGAGHPVPFVRGQPRRIESVFHCVVATV
jgi:hypothetical protein